jgi:hypothetical protein
MKIDTIKEEVTHDMDNLRKKNETEIKNTMGNLIKTLVHGPVACTPLTASLDLCERGIGLV